MRVIVFAIFGVFLFFFQPGKNSKPVVESFETPALVYKTFRHISYTPKLHALSAFIYKFPSQLWKIPEHACFFDLLIMFSTQKPINIDKKITFIEGSTSKEVLEQINSNEFLTGPAIKSLLEASIFPDTYNFKIGTNKSAIIELAKKNMSTKITQLWQKRPPNFPLTQNEWIIFASIIQKEGKFKSDMQLIADCFMLRLKKRIRLQSDACVLYGLGISNRENVYYKDLKIKTPFNTYQNSHLPPTPICAPGLDALEAALFANPEKAHLFFYTAYIFNPKINSFEYKVFFANNLKDHINNKNHCRKLQKKYKNLVRA